MRRFVNGPAVGLVLLITANVSRAGEAPAGANDQKVRVHVKVTVKHVNGLVLIDETIDDGEVSSKRNWQTLTIWAEARNEGVLIRVTGPLGFSYTQLIAIAHRAGRWDEPWSPFVLDYEFF
jgi:hypothetical protein